MTAGSGNTPCDEDGSTGVYYCPVPVAQDGGNNVSITLGGYVTNTTGSTSNRTAQTDAQGTLTVSGVQFAYKITAITTEVIGTNITTSTTALEVGDDTARNACVLSSNIWYCPVVTANSNGVMISRVVRDGYVDKNTYALTGNTQRATDATAQVTETIANVQYGYTVTGVTAEQTGVALVTTISSLSLGDGSGKTACTLSGATWYCPVIIANSDGTLTADVAKDGYVRQTTYALTGSASRALNTSPQVAGVSIANILYSYKITGVTNEIGGALSTVTVNTGDTYDVSCAESGSAWYCAVPLAETGINIVAAKDGYVTNIATSFDADRTTETDAQQTKAIAAIQFAYKVTGVTSEIGDVLTSVNVNTGDSYTRACTENGGAWYCAVPLGDTGFAVKAAKDGYVTNTTSSFGSDRTNATDPQQTVALSGIQYGNKITGIVDELGGALSTVTVNTGDGQAVLCTENTGAWYCAIPLANTSKVIQVVKDGYVTNTDTSFSADRANATDPQELLTGLTGVKFAYKITSITSEVLHTNLTATAGVLEVGDDSGRNNCTFSSGAWYCPVVLANSNGVTMVSRVANDGYVDKNTYALVGNTKRATGATGQVTETINTVQYAYTVTGISAEQTAADLTATISSLSLGDNSGQNSCTFSGATWYCPVLLANSDGTLTADVAKDGYVRQTTYALTGSTSRSASTTAQVAGITIPNILYSFKISGVANELGGALSSVTVSTGDAFAVPCTESGTAWYCSVPLAQTGIAISAIKDGYVTNIGNSFTADRDAETDPQQIKAVTGVKFSQKITIVQEASGLPLNNVIVTAAGPVTFTEDGTTGIYYGAVTEANDGGTITATKTGYKTNTSATASDRAVGTDPQGVSTATALFQLKLISANELGAAINISNLSAITFNGSAPTYATTSSAYFAVTAANAPLVVQKDGYVNAGTTNAGGLTDITTTAANQTVVTMGNFAAKTDAISTTGSNAKGLMFALKITVQREGDNSAVTGSTVTAGDSYGTNCIENASTGIHFCAIPLADTSEWAKIVKSGYAVKTLTYTDRTAVTDSQGVLLATLGTQTDTTAPTVISQTPTDNATGTAVTINPTITFSEAMDAATLNGGTIQLRRYSDDTAIGVSFTYNPSTYVVTLNPNANLSYNTQYYLWVSGAKDAAGNIESTDYSVSTKASHEFTTAALGNGALKVNSITPVKTYATADNDYSNGWSWTFDVTVPTNEASTSMKFANWVSGANTILAADNIRFYSAQSSNANSTSTAITISAANTYSNVMTINDDLDATAPGRQIQITVESKVPVDSAGGSYSTSYGIQSN